MKNSKNLHFSDNGNVHRSDNGGMKLIIFLNLCFFVHFKIDAQPIQYKRLNAEALTIVKQSQCASCHTENLSTTKPAALQIFNLSRDNWAGRMEINHLERLVWSLKGASLEEIRAMAGDIELDPLDNYQKSVLTDFLELEKSRREQDPLAIFLAP